MTPLIHWAVCLNWLGGSLVTGGCYRTELFKARHMDKISGTGQLANRYLKMGPIRIKSGVLIDIVSSLLVLVFVYTAINKTFDITRLVWAIIKIPYLGQFANIISWAVVITEYLIAILLCVPSLKRLGLYLSVMVLTCFTVYIILMKLFMDVLPCSCGGIMSQLTWNQHLVVNVILLIINISGIIASRIPKT